VIDGSVPATPRARRSRWARNRLSGSATLKLKLKKALKKGTYVVQATGTVEGKKLGLSKPLIVK